MAQNIVIAGAAYSDVPGVAIPKSGGGTAYFTDTSGDTVAAATLLRGATAHNAQGAAVTGTYTAPYNINLLHNADWGYSLVNQRGHTGAVSNAYCIDRWIGSGTVTPAAGQYVTLASGTSMTQYLEIVPSALLGQTVTFAYEASDGGTYSGQLAFPDEYTGEAGTAAVGDITAELKFRSGSARICGVTLGYTPQVTLTARSGINIVRVWLEAGGTSHMTSVPPADYSACLAACRRYFFKTPSVQTIATWVTGSQPRAVFVFPAEMRTTPSVTVSSYDVLYNNTWVSCTNGVMTANTTAQEVFLTGAVNSLTPSNVTDCAYARFIIAASADL